MNSFALYRLPHSHQYIRVVQHGGQPLQLTSVADLNGRSGFVLAPFAPTAECPILLLQPDEIETKPLPAGLRKIYKHTERLENTADKKGYAAMFELFHEQLKRGNFRKIVLARATEIELSSVHSPEELFVQACHRYPRMMVMLIHTPQSGTWLMATPEILLEGNKGEWHTMALAGTMQLDTSQLDFDNPSHPGEAEQIRWSQKNIQEQRYVARYIEDCLRQHEADFSEEGPYTIRAANLVHLRSDFRFKLSQTQKLGELLDSLHPTPAVCGIPKDACRQFIIDHETSERKYYCGFAGPIDAQGETHLYVSLRCMQIEGKLYRLYAGGGLLADSVCEQEWKETEAKMETMKGLLYDDTTQ
uniref:isochorismate synthase n=1 Tax=Prevotella sp. GTC17259 TaxID=3236795 RepID=A0AB33J6Q8_9BACT